MIHRCNQVGLPQPEFSISDGFVTTIWSKPTEISIRVTGEVERVVLVMQGEMKRIDIQNALGLHHEDYFRQAYLIPALQAHCVAMTIPDKPKSSRQKYCLTDKGGALQNSGFETITVSACF